MSDKTPRFRVMANSRHPALGRDYNPTLHRYESGYINPRGYTVSVKAFPGKDLVDVIQPERGGPLKPIKIERLKVPSDTVAFDFSISKVGQSFSRSKSKPVKLTGVIKDQPNSPWNWRVEVPSEGTYEVTVQWRDKSGRGPKSTEKIVLRDYLVVSIGDSMASGQGNPDVPGKPKGFDPDLDWWDVFNPVKVVYELSKAAIEEMSNFLKQEFTTLSRALGAKLDMDPKPVWQEKNAYRSLRSGPAMVARQLEELRAGRMVTFLSFARTGSEIQAGLLGPRTDNGKPGDLWVGGIGQVQEAKKTLGSRRIDALVITIGVNDIGVAGTLTDLVENDLVHNDAQARKKTRREAEKRLAQLPARFDQLAAALETLNIRHIYLTEYPTGLFDQENGQVGRGCEIFWSDFFDADLDVEDARLVEELAEKLNAVLKAEAAKRGWFFVSGIADGFKGHGYCTSQDVRFFVRATESLIIQGDTEGTIHPNARGHAIFAQQIAAMVKTNTLDKPDLPKSPGPINKLKPGPATVGRRKPAPVTASWHKPEPASD